MTTYYLLAIDNNAIIDMQVFQTKLDLAIDWVKMLPNVYLLKSSSDLAKWKARLAIVLYRKKYFIVEIKAKSRKGFLYSYVWEWLSKNGI